MLFQSFLHLWSPLIYLFASLFLQAFFLLFFFFFVFERSVHDMCDVGHISTHGVHFGVGVSEISLSDFCSTYSCQILINALLKHLLITQWHVFISILAQKSEIDRWWCQQLEALQVQQTQTQMKCTNIHMFMCKKQCLQFACICRGRNFLFLAWVLIIKL